jgi:hypothetical protein
MAHVLCASLGIWEVVHANCVRLQHSHEPSHAFVCSSLVVDLRSYNKKFVEYCNRMDEVWVPSDFSRDVMIASGARCACVRACVWGICPGGAKG